MVDGLKTTRDANGSIVFVCANCGTCADKTYGAPNKDQAAYILVCRKCGKIFGEWKTFEAREVELRKFVGKVKTP
jgi:hypothetical protein